MSSVLLIKPYERKQYPIGLYYICVYPHMSSTYSIVVNELDTSRIFEFIEDGFTENGRVQGKNTTYFYYKVP